MLKQLEGEFRNGQLCAIVPFPQFIELVRLAYGDAKLKRILQPAATPQAVMIPPFDERAAMDADADNFERNGLPAFVVPWQGNDEGRFD